MSQTAPVPIPGPQRHQSLRNDMIKLAEDARLRNELRKLNSTSNKTIIPITSNLYNNSSISSASTTVASTAIPSSSASSSIPLNKSLPSTTTLTLQPGTISRNKILKSPIDRFRDWRDKIWNIIKIKLENIINKRYNILFILIISGIGMYIYYYHYYKPKIIEIDNKPMKQMEDTKIDRYEKLNVLLQERYDNIKYKLRNSDFSNDRLQLIIRERNRLINEKNSKYSSVEIFTLLIFDELEKTLVELEELKEKLNA